MIRRRQRNPDAIAGHSRQPLEWPAMAFYFFGSTVIRRVGWDIWTVTDQTPGQPLSERIAVTADRTAALDERYWQLVERACYVLHAAHPAIDGSRLLCQQLDAFLAQRSSRDGSN